MKMLLLFFLLQLTDKSRNSATRGHPKNESYGLFLYRTLVNIY